MPPIISHALLLPASLLTVLCASQSGGAASGPGTSVEDALPPRAAAASFQVGELKGPAREALRRNRGAKLSRNERDAKALEESLALFLAEADAGEFTDATVPPGELAHHGFFFKGLKRFSSRAKESWDPPTFLKSYSFDGETYFITVAFTGEREGAPFLHKLVELKAVPHADSYRFTSPFPERTARLTETKIGNVTFRHGTPLGEVEARRFVAFRKEFSDLTGLPNLPIDYYCFGSLDELLASFGFVFDCTKCNFLAHDLGFFSPDRTRFYTGTDSPSYIFEYVDGQLSKAMPNAKDLYDPIVVGVGVCFGGFGLDGSSLSKLKGEFRDALAANPDMDFLVEFKKGRGSSVNDRPSFYVLSAILSEMALESGNFDSARRLLYSGAKGERFFANLDDVLGVNESNFQRTIVQRIAAK